MAVKTSWCSAKKDIHAAMDALLACIDAGNNAWLEIRENGDQEYPIMMANPALDDPFNWQFSYGIFCTHEELIQHKFFNDTEKDLTFHWIAKFGSQEAINAYKKSREIQKDLITGIGTCFPIRIEDAQKHRDTYIKDGYLYKVPDMNTHSSFWADFWKPKDRIPYHVPDPNVGKVFTICYDDNENGHISKPDLLIKASEFLKNYAENLRNEELNP